MKKLILAATKIIPIKTLVATLLCICPTVVFAYTPIQDLVTVPILTPSLALRQTSKLRLDNGLEVLLISDRQADKSAAALVVKVGSKDEPQSQPGLAHFLEHMLFMGTEKYPDESDFDQFLSDHGGNTNAFTADDITAYVFSVNTAYFEGALDRFAYFFKEPLFNASGVKRELQAIDQEYAKNIENDDVRVYQVLKELSRQDHFFHRFSMGNSQSLENVSRQTLIDWYKSYYSADRMHLVVISPLPLADLEKMVERDFKNVTQFPVTIVPSSTETVWTENLAHMVYVESIKDQRQLTLFWEIPLGLINKLSKPEAVICAILGDEGEGSLSVHLKNKGLANSLACGQLDLNEQLSLFQISIELSAEGLKQIDTVVESVFQAIAKIKDAVIPSYLFDDLQRMALLAYQYQSRQDPFEDIMNHAYAIAYEPLNSYPMLTALVQQYDADLVRKFIDHLTPVHALYLLAAPAALTGVQTSRKETWLNVPYEVQAISADWLKRWSQASAASSMQLPPANSYLPSPFDVIDSSAFFSEKFPVPLEVKNEASGHLYYAADTQFGLPKSVWKFYLKTPFVKPTPYKAAMIELFVNYVNDALITPANSASNAGLDFRLSGQDFGLLIELSGYNEKMDVLLNDILKQLMNSQLDPIRLERAQKQLLQEYQNEQKNPPYLQAMHWLRATLYQYYPLANEKARELQKIDSEKFTRFFKNVLTKVYIEGLIYGNSTKEEAEQAFNAIETQLNAKPAPYMIKRHNNCLIISKEKGPFYLEPITKSQGNVTLLAIENGAQTAKTHVCREILMQAMKAAFFNQLRTQQQTGYLVKNFSLNIEKELFSCFMVQSNSHDARDLLARFELFLANFTEEMQRGTLTRERFEKIRQALLLDLEHPAKNQEEMAYLLFNMAFKNKQGFSWLNQCIEALQNLTYEECLAWADYQYGPLNKQRMAICMKGSILNPYLLDYHKLKTLSDRRLYGIYQ